MNWIDGFSLGLILFLVITGAWSGLVKSIFRLASVGVASSAAWYGVTPCTHFISKQVEFDPAALKVGVGVVLFIGTLILVLTIGNFLSKLINKTPASTLNRIGGALLGLIKAVLILIVLSNIFLIIPWTGKIGAVVNDSQSIRLIKSLNLHPEKFSWQKLPISGISLKDLPLDALPLKSPNTQDSTSISLDKLNKLKENFEKGLETKGLDPKKLLDPSVTEEKFDF